MSIDESDQVKPLRAGIKRKERVIVYVDGMNLYHGIRSAGILSNLWLDVRALSMSFLRPGQVLHGVKYYMSRFSSDGEDVGMVRRQGIHMKALETLGDLELIEGKFQGKKGLCRRCGNEWQTFEEKMTDVNIAVEMVCDAEDGIFDTALLVSGDGDLTGPIARVLSRHPEKRVVVAFPPRRRSEALRDVATAYFYIRQSSLRNSQLPDRLHGADGYPLHRPPEWS